MWFLTILFYYHFQESAMQEYLNRSTREIIGEIQTKDNSVPTTILLEDIVKMLVVTDSAGGSC